jgi:hypothetical protein
MRGKVPLFAYGKDSRALPFEVARAWWKAIVERGDLERERAVTFDFVCRDRQHAVKLAAYIAEQRGYKVQVKQATHPGYTGKWQVHGETPHQRLSFATLRLLLEWLGTVEVMHNAQVVAGGISVGTA